jgi:group II intron reverse transcriptase/maturase
MIYPRAKIKAHSLTGRITLSLLHTAFKAVKRNRGAAGIDKVSVHMFELNLDENLQALERDLKDGSFQPFPLRRCFIPKNETEFRPLGIPAVRDRVAQEALRRLLQPIFERLFHDSSYGFRPGRNAHQALQAVLELHDQGYTVVVDADIKGFFDNLPFAVIMEALAAQVADGNILRLIERFLRAGVMENGVFKPTTVGTPQGGVISPLLANIVLNHLDGQLQKHGYRFVRYADDFVVLCRTKTEAEEALALVQRTLAEIGLSLSSEKTQITTFTKGYSFLGFVLSRRSRRMRMKSVKKFKDKVRDLTPRSHNLDAALIEKLNRVIRGTAHYFATVWFTGRHIFQKLDAWMRMRLRCMKYKQLNYEDNRRLRIKWFGRFGLLSLESFCSP